MNNTLQLGKLSVMPEEPKLEIVDEKAIVLPTEPVYQKQYLGL